MAEEPKRGPVPAAQTSRDVIQTDTVDYGNNFIRESDVLLQSSLEVDLGKVLLLNIISEHFDVLVKIIQTAGISGFKKEFVMDVLSTATSIDLPGLIRKTNKALSKASAAACVNRVRSE